MKSEDYEVILDALDTTAIYVISEERHEILYYNQRVRDVAPGVKKGLVCHELWAGKCENCPLIGIGDKKRIRSPILMTLLEKRWILLQTELCGRIGFRLLSLRSLPIRSLPAIPITGYSGAI